MKSLRRFSGRLKRIWAQRRRKVFLPMLALVSLFLRLWPPRFSFSLLLLLELASVPGRQGAYLAFRPVVALKILKNPSFRFVGKRYPRFGRSCAHVLYGCGAFQETCELISERGLAVGRPIMSALLARSLFELGDFARAHSAIAATFSSVQLDFDPGVAAFKAELDLIAGDVDSAIRNLNRAARDPHFLCPHQNIAARYPAHYLPTQIDRDAADDGRLYDSSNFIGQRVTHVGEGQLGASLYARAFEAQDRLRENFPILSPRLSKLLVSKDISLSDLRIVPVEWFTQVGHLGMMDMLFRMRELGWWRGKAIFLVPIEAVANTAFLRLFEQYGPFLTPGGSIALPLANELFSLQRWSGMAFNAFRLPDGQVVPWQEAGALMMQQWEREKRPYPLRDEYDRILGSSSVVRHSMDLLRSKWGMRPDDWYVCLHMRDAAHYGELSGTGQTHRNAQVSSYIQAMKYITDQGGWVIKLGGPRSPKLPKMKNVIDYARDIGRSEVADLDLIRHARLFLGTTSGLTNVAVSFGVPCALVNCITTDAQLWGDRVRFVLKPVCLKDGTLLSQRDLSSTPWRWRVFDAEVLGRFGAVPLTNSSDEILEVVKEVEALALGKSDGYLAQIPKSEDLLQRWQKQLSMAHFYGNASPSRYWLNKNADHVLREPAATPAAVEIPETVRESA